MLNGSGGRGFPMAFKTSLSTDSRSSDSESDTADIPLAQLADKWNVEQIKVDIDPSHIKLEYEWAISTQFCPAENQSSYDSYGLNSANPPTEPGHYRIYFYNESKGGLCHFCSRVIRSRNFLTTSTGEVMYGCDACPAYFINQLDIVNHKVNFHADSIEFSCRMCNEYVGQNEFFLKHLVKHDDIDLEHCELCSDGRRVKKRSTCPHCSQVFQSKSQLLEHVTKRHRNGGRTCRKCGVDFEKFTHLRRHFRDYHRAEKLICPHCNYPIVGWLVHHLEKTHPDKLFPCRDCGDNFANEENLNEHENLAHSQNDSDNGSFGQQEQHYEISSGDGQKLGQSISNRRRKLRLKIVRKRRRKNNLFKTEGQDDSKPYVCDSCGKTYVKKDHLRIHMYNHFKPLTCPICLQRFAFKTYLRNHLASHTGEKRFLCHLCGASFTQYGNLQSHIKRHTGQKRFQCSYCVKSFFLMGALKKHVRIHTGDKPFICSFCNKQFSSSGNMTRHRMIHTGEKPYKCPYCPKAFIQSTELKNHVRIHTGEPRPVRPVRHKKHTCSHCSKVFTSSAYLKAHFRVHTGERPYQCKVCEKTFAKLSSFSQHRKIHLEVKPYICNYCGKGFSQSGNFTMHLRRHTGEKPFKCETCGKCFSQPVNLTRHQTVHTGERRYVCNYCGKKFSQAHALSDHINVHTGAKPHKCMYCNSCFANQSTLSRHLTTHSHVIKAQNEDIMPQGFLYKLEGFRSYLMPTDTHPGVD